MTYYTRAFRIQLIVSLLFAFVIWARPAFALTIEQSTGLGRVQIQHFDPLGQSFLASDNDIGSVGFWISQMNPYFNDRTVTMAIFSGDGDFTVDAELHTTSLTMEDGYIGWIDLDVSNELFTAGEMYTIGIFAGTAEWAVNVDHLRRDIYDGGRAYVGDSVHYPNTDLKFRVGPGNVAAPVPEPATMLLLSTGLVGLAGFRKKFKK